MIYNEGLRGWKVNSQNKKNAPFPLSVLLIFFQKIKFIFVEIK